MTEPVNDSPSDSHAKEAEIMESLYLAQRWQQQESEAAAKACLYLTQSAHGEIPHD